MMRTISVALALVATAFLGHSYAAAQGTQPKPWAGYADDRGRPPLDCFFPPKGTAYLPKDACPPGSPGVATKTGQPDTSRWKNHRSIEWGFDISAPPDWVKLDMQIGIRRMTLSHNVDGDRKLMCHVSVGEEPRSTQMSQQEINEGLLRAGVPSPEEEEAVVRSAGQPVRVLNSSLVRIMNLPAYLYETSLSSQSMDTRFDLRQLMATLNTPGRNYILSCEASAENGARELYQQWLPTFRAVFASFIIEPQLGR